MNDYRIIVDKSTVPVGTADKVKNEIRAALDERGVGHEFDVVSNPEFLKEGAAIDDFMKPDRIVIGTDNPRTTELLRALYEPFNRNRDRVINMDIRSAELTKYAANAMLATKGAGYGGSCFPKDVRALAKSAATAGYEATLMEAVEVVNLRQKQRLFSKISTYFDGDLKGKTIALWGLSFKPQTDDMREASSRVLMESLWEAGASVRAYDPEAMGETKRIYPDQDALVLCDSAQDALQGADALAIVTEWQEFRSPDFQAIKKELSNPVIFDGRNLYDLAFMTAQGLTYYAIGRDNLPSETNGNYGRRKSDNSVASGS